MNVVIWIAQGLLAAAFLATGGMKIGGPKEKLAATMGWVDDFSQQQVRGIGALEVLGAAGLVLPGLLDLATVLTPIAATGLALTMVGAARTHLRRHEQRMLPVNVVLLALAAFVAVERFGPHML